MGGVRWNCRYCYMSIRKSLYKKENISDTLLVYLISLVFCKHIYQS